jgi:Predicted membrane protein
MVMANIQKFVVNNQRTLKKTLSYYIMHITVAMLVAYFVTGNIWMALTLSMLEPTVQAFAFFFHEKVWAAKDSRISALSENETTA